GGGGAGWRAGLGARDGRGAAVTAKVAVLAPQVADQIAAGEVVERPASVVKELVENALDAGARAIRVEMEDGGKTLIRVSDDGEGMSRVDAELALSRHATSKIRDATDLIGVATPAFRAPWTPAGGALLAGPPADGPLERLAALWGSEVVDTLLPVAHCEGPLEVRGFAQRPAQARPAGRKGYVFVRGRPIRDPFIVRAAEAGYRSTLAPGDRPSLVLFLDLPGDAVDVNVHPAKLEVRFREKFFVEKVVEEAVRRALGPLVAAAPLGAGDSGLGDRVSWNGVAVPLDLFAADSRAPSPEPRAPSLLQVFDTYILFQTAQGIAIVDQHSAHERVLYETVMRQLTGDGAPAQRLLLPLTLQFAPPELDAIDSHRELLGRVGYE